MPVYSALGGRVNNPYMPVGVDLHNGSMGAVDGAAACGGGNGAVYGVLVQGLILRIADKDEIARMERLPLMTGYAHQTDQDESEKPCVFDVPGHTSAAFTNRRQRYLFLTKEAACCFLLLTRKGPFRGCRGLVISFSAKVGADPESTSPWPVPGIGKIFLLSRSVFSASDLPWSSAARFHKAEKNDRPRRRKAENRGKNNQGYGRCYDHHSHRRDMLPAEAGTRGHPERLRQFGA